MKKYLIIVDPQNDFLPNGSVEVPGAMETMDKLVRHLTESFHLYEKIFVTIDWHPGNHCSFIANGGNLPGHCIVGTRGAEIYNPLLKLIKNELFVDKVSCYCKGVEPDRNIESVFDLDRRGDIQNASGRIMYDELNERPYDTRIAVCGISGDGCMMHMIDDLIRLTDVDYIDVLFDYTISPDNDALLADLRRTKVNVIKSSEQ